MKIYFLSSVPCALRLGGVFFGVTDLFERYAEVSLQDRLFVEFLPENGLPVTFFLTENIRFSPPEHCEVYLLKDGIAVYAAEFIPTDFRLQTLLQKRIDDTLITVFRQGGVQLAVERGKQAFTAPLPPTFQPRDVLLYGKFTLLFGESHGGKKLFVFDGTGGRVLEETALSYSLSDGILQAELPLCDRLGRTADCAWALTDDGLVRTKFTLRAHIGGEEKNDPPDGLIAYAFFESVLIGGNYRELLSEELRPNAEKIVEFLGNFESVVLTQDPTVCGLLRRKGERLFEAAYYSVKIQNGEIIDVNG